jgi:uncharacterized protein YndB with AHSA1/START domain
MGLKDNESATRNGTKVERASDRELVVTRTFDAPVRFVFAAWTRPDLFIRWWAPKSMGIPLRSCEQDVRVGGTYRIVFGKDDTETFAFFGTYLDVVPNARLVWTNEETEDGPVTTVTFEEQGDRTLLTFSELYASKEALDEMFVGMEGGMPEQFEQLVELLATLDTGAEGL